MISGKIAGQVLELMELVEELHEEIYKNWKGIQNC